MAAYFFLKQCWNRYIIVLGQLNEMNNNVPEEINKNIKDILYHILSINIIQKKEIKDKIQIIYDKNKTEFEKNTMLEELLKYLKKKEDDDEDY